jgi:TRAP-type C4-dicarboxylate transport system permease small subunit
VSATVRLPGAMAALGWVCRALAVLGAGVAMAVALVVVASVLGRAVWRTPIPGDVELTQVGIALAISLGLPWCQWERSNLIVDFFTQKMSARSLRWLDAAGALALAAMCLLLGWRSASGAVAVHQAQESSMILGLPMWWAYAALAPGLLLTAAVAVAQAVHPMAPPLAPSTALPTALPTARSTGADPA